MFVLCLVPYSTKKQARTIRTKGPRKEIKKAISRWLSQQRLGFDPKSVHVRYVVDKVSL